MVFWLSIRVGFDGGTDVRDGKKFKYVGRKKWLQQTNLHWEVVQKRTTGELRLKYAENNYCISDSHAKALFLWLGRYLAEKGKLPKHVALEEVAFKSQSVAQNIRSIVAEELYRMEQKKCYKR